MTSHAIPLARWVLLGSLLGSSVLSLYLLIYFSVVLDAVNFPGGLLSGAILYMKIFLVCLPAGAVVALIVGWIAKRQQQAGKANPGSVVTYAAFLGFLPSLLLLISSLSDGLTIDQAVNILTGFGLPPALIAAGTAMVFLCSVNHHPPA